MPFSPGCPEAPRPGSVRHPYGDSGVLSAAFCVPAAESLHPAPRVAALYPATRTRHLSLVTATAATAGPPDPHTHVRSDLYLAMAKPSYVRDSCNAVMWNKRRGSDIGSHVGSMIQTAAGGFHTSHPDPGVFLTIAHLDPPHSARW